MLNVSVNISEPTLEASEQSIEYVVSLGRIDGKRIRFIPRPLFVKLVSFGFLENVTGKMQYYCVVLYVPCIFT